MAHRVWRIGPASGFTLVELLVVIAIIGVLIGLLLPAVQAAREASRRSRCSSNLKQIGLATLSHESALRRLPPGAAFDTPPFGTGEVGWGSSWLVYLMPYMEEGAGFDRWSFAIAGNGSGHPNSNTAISLSGSKHLCPSSQLPKLSDWSSGHRRSPTDYVAVAGTSKDVLPDQDQRCWQNNYFGHCCTGGMLYPMAQMQIKNCTDGTSKMLIVGEQSEFFLDTSLIQHDWRRSARYGWHTGTNYSEIPAKGVTYGKSYATVTIRYPINQRANSWNGSTNGVGPDGHYNTPLISAHPGGTHGALLDGSVRFISETVSLDVLGRLGVRDDGQVTGDY